MNIQEKILESLKSKNSPPLYFEQIADKLNISRNEIPLIQDILDDMVDAGLLLLTKKKKYVLPQELGMIVGRLQANSKGFGFLIPDDKTVPDIFISAENMHGAMHNDKIMVRLLKRTGSGLRSREGEVSKIIEHANKTIVGTFEKDKYFGFVIPDDKRIVQDIFIPKDEMNGAKSGYKVVAEIVKWPEKRRNPEGKIIEVLGHKDDVGTDILSIIRLFNLPEEFPDDVQKAAKRISQSISPDEIKRRKDLRNLKMVTIDGADAKDLDDAVSIELLNNGNYMLGVHIADVCHYVTENSIIDKEARSRGTSVYLVDRVIPMLPRELSNGICSLNQREDRLALSVFMEISSNGKVVNHSIHESVICTNERMVYEDVTKILEENDKDLVDRYRDLIDDFKHMADLFQILNKRRKDRGSIDFDIDEAKITLDIEGKPIDVKPYERGIANKIIEEFMLVCNETIAEHMFWSEMPFVYRVHEEPNIEKLQEFNEFIHNFGYHLKGVGGEMHPRSLQDILIKIAGLKEETIISAVMLRSLQRARYSNQNLGHFGLAAKYYTHFTSPIRRYPDLIIHRIIKQFINNELGKEKITRLYSILPELADHCSQRERLADEAERETNDLKKAEYMLDKIGMEFDGVISGVTSFGIYVELYNTVEGMIRMTMLDDDFYVYDEKRYCLIGEKTKKIYRLGDTVRIKVIKSDIATRNIDFAIVN